MPSITDVDEYEKAFMVNYIKQNAQNKINELEKKLEQTEDSFKKLEIKKQIREIKIQMDEEIAEMNNEKINNEVKIDLGEKTNEIGYLDPKSFYEYAGIKIPMNIWTYLFEYQREGVCWMIDLFLKEKGGILADEMGLGKTLQVSALIASLVFSNKATKFLILAPVTVIDHWIAQLNGLKLEIKIHRKPSVNDKGVFIMSYESFRELTLFPIYDCVFLDEGHKIKNKDALITQSTKRIIAKSKFVITGTPIQNNLSELWSIFDFVYQGLLGSHSTFQEEFENKIKNNKTERDKQISYNHSVLLRSMIEPYIMRRMKYMIDHKLPGKIDKVIFVSLSDKQYELYNNTLESKRFKNCSIKGFSSNCTFLTAITYLRKICNHPLLVKNNSFENYNYKKSELESEKNFNEFEFNLTSKELVDESSKLKITFDMLDKWYSDNQKVLLFFQSVKMLQIAAKALSSFRPEFKYCVMTGSTSINQRSSLIDIFNNDKSIFIFLLTTRVGGLGINLASASRIIIFDPDWNPSTDNQAKERIYRFGQKSEVEMYRLITRDTLEEKIYQKQIYKDCLSKKILANPSVVFEKEYFFDLFAHPSNFGNDIKIENSKMVEIVNDKLVDVNQEDTKSFLILKELSSKPFLTGPELIEYIKRRETNLKD